MEHIFTDGPACPPSGQPSPTPTAPLATTTPAGLPQPAPDAGAPSDTPLAHAPDDAAGTVARATRAPQPAGEHPLAAPASVPSLSPAVPSPAQAAPSGETPPALALSPTDLHALRTLVLRAYPTAPPHLVTGQTLADLIASAEQAEQLARQLAARTLPAGQPPRDPTPLPLDQLSPSAKIAHGLRRYRP